MVITGGITDRDLKDTKEVDGKAAIIGQKMCRGSVVQKLASICRGALIAACCLRLLVGW